MTKLELMAMLEGIADDAEITFVESVRDRDGYPQDERVKVYKVLGGEVVSVRGECGCYTLENLTDEIEYIRWNEYGGYYRRKK